MTHIRIILPADAPAMCNLEMLKPYEKPGMTLSISYTSIKADSLRSEFEISAFSNAVLQKILEAQNDNNVDAIVINIMAEMALAACYEAANIPVVSLPQIAFSTAAILSNKFSIVSSNAKGLPLHMRLIQKYRLEYKFASYRNVHFSPQDDYYTTESIAKIANECIKAIEEDNAGAIVFGSGRMLGMAESITTFLNQKGYDIPLIEPLPLGIQYAKLLADLQLKPSKTDYPFPNPQSIHQLNELVK